jgi:hypothetical protein
MEMGRGGHEQDGGTFSRGPAVKPFGGVEKGQFLREDESVDLLRDHGN